jgi:O-antigen/teichoic acid export membrane protein
MGYLSAVVIVIQLASVPVLAHAWGLPLYGQWLMLVTVPSFLASGDFGFGSAAGARIVAEVAREEFDSARTTFASARALILALSSGTFLIALAVSALLPDRFLAVSGGMDSHEARVVLIVLVLYGILAIQAVLYIAVSRAHGAFAPSMTVMATVLLLEGLAVIGVAWFGGSPLEAAFAYLAVRSVGTAGQVLLARRKAAAWISHRFKDVTRARVSELFRPALAAMLMPLARAGFLQGAPIAVGAAAGAAAVPIYTSLRTLSRVGVFFIFALNKPILPEYAAEFARDNMSWVRKATGATITFNAMVGMLTAIVLALVGDSLLAWWTNGAIEAPQLMIYFTAAAVVAGAVWEPNSVLLLAINRHERFTYILALGSAAAVALCYLFTRQWGVTGAAAATCLFEFAMLVFILMPLRLLIGSFPIGPRVLVATAQQTLRRVK